MRRRYPTCGPDRPIRPRQRALPPCRLSVQLRRAALEDAAARSQNHDPLYNNTVGGICGNEDCGQMSAWYVFSALGFYPVNPVSGVYVIGSPLVIGHDPSRPRTSRARVHDHRQEQLAAERVHPVGDAQRPTVVASWISHAELAAGGKLVFKMGPRPNVVWGPLPATGRSEPPASGSGGKKGR